MMRMCELLQPFRHFFFRRIFYGCLWRISLAQEREELPHPVQATPLALLCAILDLFVGQVRGDAVERLAMLCLCAQLHFQGASIPRVDRGMDTLIAVGLGEGDVVLYFSGHGPPVGVNDAQ